MGGSYGFIPTPFILQSILPQATLTYTYIIVLIPYLFFSQLFDLLK